MLGKLYKNMRASIDNWLTEEPDLNGILPYDFNRLKYEIKPVSPFRIDSGLRINL